MPNSPTKLSVLFALGVGALSSCKAMDAVLNLDFVDFPDSRIENLERLHTPAGKHHYAVQFVGDVEHSFNRSGRMVGGIRVGRAGGSDGTVSPKKPLANPSLACFELLNELLEFDGAKDPRLAAMQITWCARIIADDPSHVSREVATLALGSHGQRLGIEGPVFLDPKQPRASARETAELLTQLIAAWRSVRDGYADPETLRARLKELTGTTFDLAGCRRVLPALAGLLRQAESDKVGYDEVFLTLKSFQVRTIELALAEALNSEPGPSSRVRAAAVVASVEAGGAPLLVRFVASVLRQERRQGANRDALLVVAILEQVARLGFPDSDASVPQNEFVVLRESWVDLIVGIAVEDSESFVRVKAMQALAKVTDGPHSLREEDWEEWYYVRVARRREADGLPRVPDAVEVTEESDS